MKLEHLSSKIFTDGQFQWCLPTTQLLKGRGTTREHLPRIMRISMYKCTIMWKLRNSSTYLVPGQGPGPDWVCADTPSPSSLLSSILVSARSRSLPGARLRVPASSVDTAPWDSGWTITSCEGLCDKKSTIHFSHLKLDTGFSKCRYLLSHPITAREKIRDMM